MEPEPQKKRRGIRHDPLHIIGELSAVKRWIPLSEDDLGPGNTETEAPESTRNSRLESIPFTNRRVELQSSSGAEATGGLAGWTIVFTCQTTCFPKRNKVSCSCWPSHHVSYETNRDQTELEIWTLELKSENAWREGSSQSWESSKT